MWEAIALRNIIFSNLRDDAKLGDVLDHFALAIYKYAAYLETTGASGKTINTFKQASEEIGAISRKIGRT